MAAKRSDGMTVPLSGDEGSGKPGSGKPRQSGRAARREKVKATIHLTLEASQRLTGCSSTRR